MTLGARLEGLQRVFVDTAPFIYLIEAHERYLPMVAELFERLEAGTLAAVTSPVTLAECLVLPLRSGRDDLARAFRELIVDGPGITLLSIDHAVGARAAHLRARYGITLADALQVAAALEARCDAFLTNDHALAHVSEISMLVLADLDDR